MCLAGKEESEVEEKMRENRDGERSRTLPAVQSSPAQPGIIQKRVVLYLLKTVTEGKIAPDPSS